MNLGISSRIPPVLLLLITAVLLSIAAVYAQVDYLGLHFIRVQQEKVHLQMLQGVAGNPWQYRILADLMIDLLIRLLERWGYSHPESLAFVGFRFLQCVFILSTAGIYYKKVGLRPYANLLGLSILTWSMSYSLYNSDLSFNVFFDIAFYLLAGILILERQLVWVILLMLPAALNRETSLLIPAMLVGFYYAERQGPSLRRAIVAAAAAFVVYGVVFVGLRLHYGRQEFLTADGFYPGLQLLVLNIRRWVTWEQLLITLGIIPLLAVLAYGTWPPVLRTYFWSVVPLWVAVHFVGALVAETRLMLVPQALVFIPGALCGLAGAVAPQEDSS